MVWVPLAGIVASVPLLATIFPEGSSTVVSQRHFALRWPLRLRISTFTATVACASVT